MVHWRREKGRGGARGQWAPDASWRNVEISLHEREGARVRGNNVSTCTRSALAENQRDLHAHLPIAASQFL